MSDEQRVPSCWPEDEHEWGDEVSLLPHPSGPFFPGAIMSRKCVHCNVRTIRATDASVDREWLTHCWLQAVERAGGSVWDIWFEP
ncbi:MAG: hypothetical protein M3Q31_12735 [Actinomycetota bacterium]|nr:hypothetical protein [Actinomycetota bacterium]